MARLLQRGALPDRTPAQIVVVAQGRKCGYLADEVYRYDAEHYLVLAVPMPFECETFASAVEPLLGLTVELNLSTLTELLLEMNDTPPVTVEGTPRGIQSTRLGPELSAAVLRLVQCLHRSKNQNPGSSTRARTCVLRSSRRAGVVLRAMTDRRENFTRIARTLQYMQTHSAKPLTIQELAHNAGMSVSVFHEHFKQVTATTPLQYLNRCVSIRRARFWLAVNGRPARPH